jgi:hypothetical protein
MTEADDNVVELHDLDQLFEDVLAGQALGPEAPAWSADLARLVHGARVEGVPGELAGHDAIVASMVEVRQSAVAAGDATDAGQRATGDHAAPVSRPVTVATAPPDAAVAASAATGIVGAPHVARHARGDRGYRAKHAAARTSAPGNPTARNVGRLIAVKAAAVTTAVVVGTVAAAAATTGIVANVVVPAFTSEAPDTPPASKTTTGQGSGGGADGVGDDDLDTTVAVPECQLAPVCSPLTPAFPAPDDAVPARPTGPTVPTTERPGTSTTTTEPPATTTTETPPTTTEPEPTTTTTGTPPTTSPEPESTLSTGGAAGAP